MTLFLATILSRSSLPPPAALAVPNSPVRSIATLMSWNTLSMLSTSLRSQSATSHAGLMIILPPMSSASFFLSMQNLTARTTGSSFHVTDTLLLSAMSLASSCMQILTARIMDSSFHSIDEVEVHKGGARGCDAHIS